MGLPPESLGKGLDIALGLSPYSVPFLRITDARSKGINDLCHGIITSNASAWVALPPNVGCSLPGHGLTMRTPPTRGWLVSLDCAPGRHRDPQRHFIIDEANQCIACNMGHLELLHRRGICRQLRSWLRQRCQVPANMRLAKSPNAHEV